MLSGTPIPPGFYAVRGDVYVLHFDQPLGHARHYTGFAKAGLLAARLAEHERGCGARLTQVALERGIGWTVAKVFEGVSLGFEWELKIRRRTACAYCPLCAGERLAHRRMQRRTKHGNR